MPISWKPDATKPVAAVWLDLYLQRQWYYRRIFTILC